MKKTTLLDFEKNHTKKTERWLTWISLCLLLLIGKTSFAQVNAYSFAQSQETYANIASTGTLVVGSDSDAVNTYDTSTWTLNLPFTFNYNSLNYTSISVNSNGGANFGLANTGSALLSSTTAYDGAIAVMNRDLWGVFYTLGATTTGSNTITNVASFRGLTVGKLLRTGNGIIANTTVTSFDQAAGTITMSTNANATSTTASIGWGSGKIITKTDGTAPNRIFTIQWEGYNDYGTAGTGSNYMSFQLKLTETSNTVKIVYGDYLNLSTTSRTNQVGLRGATNADFLARSGAVGISWNSTLAATVNSATVARDNVNFPASGLSFTWSPPTCLPPGALTATSIATNGATLGWTSTGTTFDVQYGTQGFTLGTGTIVSATTNTYVLNTLNPSTSYSFYVRKNCGATDGFSVWAGPFNFTTACGIVTAFTENFDTYTLVGATNPLPNCWTRFGNTASSYITTGSTTPLTAPNRLYLSATATGTTLNAVAVMPPVSNLQAGTHRLRFQAFATATGKALELGYYQSNNDPNSFVVLEAFDLPSTANTNATVFNYTPQFVPAGVQSLAFRNNGAAFTGTTTMYIDNVSWEPLPACFDIGNVTFTNVTGSTVDIEWNPGGTETAWEYAYAVSTVTSPTGLTPVLLNDNPFTTITNLNSSTTYNLWVRSKCGTNLYGNWSSIKTFTTACAAVTTLPWNEGFEGISTTGTTNFPPCWFKEIGDWSSSSETTYNTAKSGTKYIRNAWSSTNEYMWTPGMTLTAGVSYDFSFYMQGDGFTGWLVDIFQNTQQSSVGASQIGQTVSPTGPGTQVIQPYQLVKNTITVNADGVYYFAIRVNQPLGTPWYIAFDDFRMEVTPTCIAPTVETATNVTSTTASVNWASASVPANGYQYFLTTDTALVPNASTVPTGTVAGTVSQVNLTNLVSATIHKFYVRALCTTTDISSWSAAGTFTTACGIVTTFSQNFDTSATGTTAAMPLCWERAGNGTTYVTTGGIAPGSAPNRLYLFATGIAPATQAFAIMPPVSNLQANTHRLKFKAFSSSSAGRPLEIGYFTNPADVTTFVSIESVILPGTLAAAAQTFTINPSSIPTGIISLAFRNAGTPTASSAIYIDDVVWEAKPTVTPICATNVLATPNTTCGNFATVITWTATTDTDGYYLRVGTTAGASNVVNNLNVGITTSYNFLANANTTYFYTITPFNSAGPATGCMEQSFVTATNGCYCTSVPTSNDGAGISNVQVGNQNFPTGDVMYFDHTATPVDLAQGITNNLKVTLATGITYGTNVWIDLNNNFTFEANELFFSGESVGTNPYIQNASFLMPANAPLGQHRMRIVSTDIVQSPANPCYSGTYGVTLDFTVNITPAPTCLAPLGLSVVPSSITTTGATINWNPSTTTAAGGYQYYFATTNAVPTVSTTPSGSVGVGITTANLTGLASSSVQYVYVRAICSTTDASAWSQALQFFTLCDTNTLPYTIDFESVTVPNLPGCTINENVGTGNNWITAVSPGSGFTSNALKYGWNGSNAANTWFFTNRFNLVAGTQYSVSYKYGATSASWIEKLKVAYGSTANSAAMTTPLADHPNINTAGALLNTVTFTPAVSGSYVIGFNAYSATNQFNLYVDDILIQEVLGTNDFDTNKFVAYPNPVKNNLTIRYNENINNVSVFNLLGQELFSKNINTTEGSIDMSNLASGTYLLKVTSGDKVQTVKVIKE